MLWNHIKGRPNYSSMTVGAWLNCSLHPGKGVSLSFGTRLHCSNSPNARSSSNNFANGNYPLKMYSLCGKFGGVTEADVHSVVKEFITRCRTRSRFRGTSKRSICPAGDQIVMGIIQTLGEPAPESGGAKPRVVMLVGPRLWKTTAAANCLRLRFRANGSSWCGDPYRPAAIRQLQTPENARRVVSLTAL